MIPFDWEPIVLAFKTWMNIKTPVHSDMEVMSAIFVTRDGLRVTGVTEQHEGISYEILINCKIDPAIHDIKDFLDLINQSTGWLVNTPEEVEAARQYLATTCGTMIICRHSRMIVPLLNPVV